MAQFDTINLAEIYGAADSAKLRNMQMERAQRDLSKQDALEGAYVFTPDGQLDVSATEANLGKVSPKALYDFRAGNQEMAIKGKNAALEQKTKTAKYFRDRLASVVDQPGYEAVYNEAMQMDPSLVQGAPRDFNPDWVKRQIMDADKYLKQFDYGAPVATSEGYVQFSPTGESRKTGFMPKSEAPASVKEYEYAKSQVYTGSFEDFSTTQKKAGATNISTSTSYNPNPLELGKTGQGKVDEDLLNNSARIARLTSIQNAFKPEYANVGNRTKLTALSAMSKFGKQLDPKDQKQLGEFAEYKRTAITNLNQTIKDLTGAAMGVQEADRIISSLPNPGTGIFDGDDATTFQSKLNGAIKEVKNALARSAYIKRNGMSINDVPLERMPALMNERGQAIERELIVAQPGLAKDKKALQRRTRERLSQEFGLVSE